MLLPGCHIADQLILYPTTHPLDSPGLSRLEVPSTSGGAIEVFVARSSAAKNSPPKACVLSFIGNAARAEYMAPQFAENWSKHPVEIWCVNYPGYGTSTGPARLNSIAPTALAVYDELRRQHPGMPIFVEAQSIGTTAALYLAAHRPVAGCILHNPPPLRSLILGQFGWWNLWLLAGPIALAVPSDLDSITNAKNAKVPAIFVTADADTIVPPNYQMRVINAYAGPKQVIHLRDAEHNDPPSDTAVIQLKSAMDKLWNAKVKGLATEEYRYKNKS
jgi:pimeloyl-ACP methyl ester carboxylesterase